MAQRRLLALLLGLATTAPWAGALEFDMVFQTKCVMEDMHEGTIVVGDYSGILKDGTEGSMPLDAKVQDPSGRVIYDKRGQRQGQFAFTAKMSGDYKACFTAKDLERAQATKIRLDWKTGVAATDWDAIAKKEHLDGMATELRKLETTVREIHAEMIYLRQREEQMRDINEATNDRVAKFSIISLVVCVCLAAWQLWHLRSFFRRKKVL